MADQHLTDIAFHRLGLPEVLLQAVDAAGFQFCTPIQAQALPVALGGGDVAGQAQTGTGKTAAFLLAMYNHLFKHDPRGGAHRGDAGIRPEHPDSVGNRSVDTEGAHDSIDGRGRTASGTTVEEADAGGPGFATCTDARVPREGRSSASCARGTHPSLDIAGSRERLHPCTSPRAVIVAPTRELAVQIHKDAEQLGRRTGYRLGLVFGGTGYDSQRRQLESGVDVLIGTPGRMIDYYKQRLFDLKSVQVMILDEADRMFDLGFIKDIRFLLRRMPPPDRRLNMLFSATLSYRVTELAYEHMNNPQFIRIEPDKRTVDKVEQLLYHVAIEEKSALLVGLLRRMDPTRSLVFVNTKDMAETLIARIQGNGLSAEVLSGDVPQKTRLRLLQDFIEGRLPILVATDVAARGLHIPDVSHVFNFDLPQNAEDYVHRIGRTARAGKSGDAISFACERYVFSLMEIEAYLGHKIPVAQVTPDLLAELAPAALRGRRDEHRGRRRGRSRREAGRAPGNPRTKSSSEKNRNPSTRQGQTSVAASREKSGSLAPSKRRRPDSKKRARESNKSGVQVSSGQSRRTQKPGTARHPRRSGSDKPVIG